MTRNATMSPPTEYRARLERWRQSRGQLQQRYRSLGNARLAVAVAGVAIAAASLGGGWISAWWLLSPLIVFVALALAHDRVDRSLKSALRGTAFYERALARCENRWMGLGSPGEAFRDPQHLYAGDLDLFGRGSLFELLSTARTAAGERILAGWLLAPGDLETVQARQAAVAELANQIDLREQIALLGDEVRAAADDHALKRWGELPPVNFFPGARVLALALAATAVAALALFVAGICTLRPFLGVLAAQIAFGFATRTQVLKIAGTVGTPAQELDLLARMLELMEAQRFSSPALAHLCESIQIGGRPASKRIAALRRLVHHLDSARNQFFRAFAAPLLWVSQFAMAIEKWRQRYGPHIGRWMAAVGEFEALCSLASFAYERPVAVFPELLPARPPHFEAAGLAHPLLAPGQAVPNDVALHRQTPLWIVSGSNMSGKSTLLRAVGLNTVLAWAGAPVTASRLRVSPLRIGASMRAVDFRAGPSLALLRGNHPVARHHGSGGLRRAGPVPPR